MGEGGSIIDALVKEERKINPAQGSSLSKQVLPLLFFHLLDPLFPLASLPD